MKKIFLLFILLLGSFVLSGCESDYEDDTDPEIKQAQEEIWKIAEKSDN